MLGVSGNNVDVVLLTQSGCLLCVTSSVGCLISGGSWKLCVGAAVVKNGWRLGSEEFSSARMFSVGNIPVERVPSCGMFSVRDVPRVQSASGIFAVEMFPK